MAKLTELPEKYRKALTLLEAGNLTYREIAKQCSINESNFYDLIEGKADNLGSVQEMFTKSLQEIHKRRDKEIRDLVKSNKKETHLLINRWVLDQKRRKKVTNKLMPTIVSVANALAKSTPNVEIGSFTYQKGLSAEDIANEWKRLKGIADAGVDRRGVRGFTPGGTREGLMAEGAGDRAPEEPEDPILPAEPETGEFSP